MIKIVTVIGARPQIIKAAALSRTIKNSFSDQISEIIVHTGQHYDTNMSQVFFDELGIPTPHYNLNVGSANHGKQTADMIIGIENILLDENPDYLILYGDTNSTLAGAIVASKIHIPIVHIEAGLRSFNKSMPEEINRIMCDHASTLLFSPTETGFNNLIAEGFKKSSSPFTNDNPGIFHCGDVMYDNSLHFKSLANKKSNILKKLNANDNFILCTIHRNSNTDDPEKLQKIFSSIIKISSEKQIILPLHPRTKKMLATTLNTEILQEINSNSNIVITDPVSFLDMIALESSCSMVITDSGGVQKEAYFFNKPCIILRPETEWVEIVNEGTAIVTDSDKSRILTAYQNLSQKKNMKFPNIFGDGNSAGFICKTIIENYN